MQLHDVLAHPRDQVADVRRARPFGGEALLQRGNLVGEMRERPAGIGLSRFRLLVVNDDRRGSRRRICADRVRTVCEKAVALRLGPHARRPRSQIPALDPVFGHVSARA